MVKLNRGIDGILFKLLYRIIVMIGILCLLCSCAQKQTAQECSKENGAFMDPNWIVYPQDEAYYGMLLNKMRLYQIHYQFIDCGYFDKDYQTGEMYPIDGNMPAIHYAALDSWISYYSQSAPDMMLIASVNGSAPLHLHSSNKMHIFENIADYCQILAEKGADGINLDFEPVAPQYKEDYLTLIGMVRERIGLDLHLSVCVPVLSETFPDEDIKAYAAAVDMLVVMDYDTYPSAKNAQEYIDLISKNAVRIKSAAGQCAVLPIGPGYYEYGEYHKAFENTQNHSEAIKHALGQGGVFAGSGMWWFKGVVENQTEERMYLESWIIQHPNAE